jgi:DNA-binding transcriptional LysR family regulator
VPSDPRIERRLTLRELRILVAVAERKSMAKAAVDLALTQPAVTKAIREMEHALGVRLFDRTSRGAEQTPYGRALLKWSGVILDDLHQAVKEVEFLTDPAAGELRIGAIQQPVIQGLLPTILDRLSRQYPRIAFHVSYAGNTAEAYRQLHERKLDLIVGRLIKSGGEDNLVMEVLFEDPLHVVAGTRNRWTRRRSIQVAELANEPWILPPPAPMPDSAVWPYIAEAFHASGLEVPRASVISNSVPLAVEMISTGRFLAMIPRSLVWFSGKRLEIKVLPVKLPIHPPPVGVVTLRNRTISPVANLFIECARSVAKPLADRSRQSA